MTKADKCSDASSGAFFRTIPRSNQWLSAFSLNVKLRQRAVILILVGVIAASAYCANAGFNSYLLVLYQPDSVLKERVPSIEALAAYEKRVDKACTEFFATDRYPKKLDIVIGIKPGRKVRVWFVSSGRAADIRLTTLRRRLEAIPPCDVRNGPLAFCIRSTIAGAAIPKDDDQLPTPREWRVPLKDNGPIPDSVFRTIWPD